MTHGSESTSRLDVSVRHDCCVAASFVIDRDPIFAYMGWHLAHSLVSKGGFRWADLHVQFTPEVTETVVETFAKLGCITHRITPFGDGKYCNKIAQWDNLREVDSEIFVFLDTDMICVSSFIDSLPVGAVGGKIVDLPNPDIDLLDTLFEMAGLVDRPATVKTDAAEALTYRGNCNGGFYSVPRSFADRLFSTWKKYAEFLLNNVEPLRAAGREAHVDQISFCMAVDSAKIPFEQIASNLNYYVHFCGPHRWRNDQSPLSLLHYHNGSLNVVGLLAPAGVGGPEEQAAVDEANRLITENFNPTLFWDFRYDRFPDRGSGVGSRGENLSYKRELLRREGAERALSVLDVGCGDLEVLRELNLQNYVGIDRSAEALAKAAAARPDWTFLQAPVSEVDDADLTLCFEVAIHQKSAEEYQELIRAITEKTRKTLIISGYDDVDPQIAGNHMLYFYEPLRVSLERTGKFSEIKKIGEHCDVSIYRCDVSQGRVPNPFAVPGVDAWKSLAKGKYGSWASRVEVFKDAPVLLHHRPKFTFPSDARFFCMGSCFARNIEEHLIYRGIDVLSKRIISPIGEYPGRVNAFTNKFSTHSMANELEWVVDKPDFDARFFAESESGWHDLQLSPGMPPVTFDRVVERRRYLTGEYFSRIRDATVLILTLGLNEVWYDTATGRYLNGAPSFFSVRRDRARYSLEITDAAQNIAQLEKIYGTARSINPDIRIVVTVSPVPMSDTFSGEDVVLANMRSKSTLRAAADTFARTHASVDYFPSYEMVTMAPRELAYEADCIHVENDVVGRIMREFISLYLGTDGEPAPFNESAYLAANPDVETAVRLANFASGFEHWMHYGQKEGRRLAPVSGPFSFPWLQPAP